MLRRSSLGPVGSAGKKDEAMQLLSVKCETPWLTENCVDCTFKCATVLHAHNLIDDATLARMKTELDENKAETRKAAAPHFAKVVHPKP